MCYGYAASDATAKAGGGAGGDLDDDALLAAAAASVKAMSVSGGASGSKGGAGGADEPAEIRKGGEPSKVPHARGVNGFTDYYLKHGQTDPPTIPVRRAILLPPQRVRLARRSPRPLVLLYTHAFVVCCCAGVQAVCTWLLPSG